MSKEYQNIAENLQVSPKQHNLFAPVKSVNPAIIMQASAGIQIQVTQTTTSSPDQVDGDAVPDSGGMDMNQMPKMVQSMLSMTEVPSSGGAGYNTHLFGSLTPCKKQYFHC